MISDWGGWSARLMIIVEGVLFLSIETDDFSVAFPGGRICGVAGHLKANRKETADVILSESH